MEILYWLFGGFIYLVMWGVCFEAISPYIKAEHGGVQLFLSLIWWVTLPVVLGCTIVEFLRGDKL